MYVRNLSELSEESQSTTSSLRKRMINQLRIGSDIIQEEDQEMGDNFKAIAGFVPGVLKKYPQKF
jgi:hypothetical protein